MSTENREQKSEIIIPEWPGLIRADRFGQLKFKNHIIAGARFSIKNQRLGHKNTDFDVLKASFPV